MSAEIIAALHAIVGDAGLKTGDTDTEAFLTDWHGQYRGRSLAVVMPETTEQVSQVMALADAHDIVVVPQGGNTGFMGGATPDHAGNSILLSLRRMNRIREIDATNMSMTVEAGCVLQTLMTRPRSRASISRSIWRQREAAPSAAIWGPMPAG